MLRNQTVTRQNTPQRAPERPSATPRRASITEEDIRRRAYELYEKRNREPGHELEDWAQAERELRGQQG